MYKRDRFVFVSNLKEVTCDPSNPRTLRRDAYLLSQYYSSPKTVELAAMARGRKNTLFSDNGNFTRMSALAERFEPAGERLLAEAEEAGAWNRVLEQKKSALVGEVVQACDIELARQDMPAIVAEQMQIDPHVLVGLEDFTIPVLQIIGLLQPELRPTSRDIRSYQNRTRRLFLDQVRGRVGGPLNRGVLPLLVIHAYHYSSAYQAARAAARYENEIQGVAVSYGASMRSNRWITEARIGRRKMKFGEKLPEKYIVSQLMLLGAVRGMGRPVHVHLLGAGSPIVWLLSALVLPYARGVSADSTSPFKDADDGVVYGSRQAFLKMKMYKLAAYCLVEDRPYESRQPFWRWFEGHHPSDWAGLRKALKVTADDDIGGLAKTLYRRQDLVRRYIPYFTKARAGTDPFMTDLRIARAGSNYWVLNEICQRVRRRADDPERLWAWIEDEVARYEAVAHGKWAKSVRTVYTLSRTLLPGPA